MHMDDKTYENPAAFIPERFSEHTKLAPEYAAGDWEKRGQSSSNVMLLLLYSNPRIIGIALNGSPNPDVTVCS